MINNSDTKSNINWWNNPAVMAELEQEYRAWESGKVKGHGWVELKTEIARRKNEKGQGNEKSTKQ
jgi:hypothetical protein